MFIVQGADSWVNLSTEELFEEEEVTSIAAVSQRISIRERAHLSALLAKLVTNGIVTE